MRQWDADVFRGPVKYIYPDEHPEWLRMKEFDGGPSGAKVRTGTTNNLAANSKIFSREGLNLQFDKTLRFSGGEDVDLFRRAVAKGTVIRWVATAEVQEKQTGNRLTSNWHVRRTEAISASVTYIDMRLMTPAHRPKFLFYRCARIIPKIATDFLHVLLAPLARHSTEAKYFKLQKRVAKFKGVILGAHHTLPRPYEQVVES
jgi:hypothetical protein